MAEAQATGRDSGVIPSHAGTGHLPGRGCGMKRNGGPTAPVRSPTFMDRGCRRGSWQRDKKEALPRERGRKQKRLKTWERLRGCENPNVPSYELFKGIQEEPLKYVSSFYSSTLHFTQIKHPCLYKLQVSE